MAETLEPLRRSLMTRFGSGRFCALQRQSMRQSRKLLSMKHANPYSFGRRSAARAILPQRAWQGESFEFLAAGRTTLAARVRSDDIDLWALRGDDPDKEVPGRVWTTEVALGRQQGQATQLSLRLLVASPEKEPDFDPAVARLLLPDGSALPFGLKWIASSDVPWLIDSDEDLSRLIELLEAPARRLPVFLASGDERAHDPGRPLIDADTLSRARPRAGACRGCACPLHLWPLRRLR